MTVVDDDGISNSVEAQRADNQSFNAVLGSTIAVCLVFLFVSALFGDSLVTQGQDSSVEQGNIPIWERYLEDYALDGDFGFVLEEGQYTILETANEWNSTHHFVEYVLPIEEGGAAPNGLISLAVWSSCDCRIWSIFPRTIC
jgi:hypothetical protein